MESIDAAEPHWYVLRDLKRANAKNPAYKVLAEAGFDVFTPMMTKVVERNGRRIRAEVPFIQDLLFVRSQKEPLDIIVARTETLQYRYVRGAAYCTPLTVPVVEMARFIAAVRGLRTPRYYGPNEITSSMYGCRIRMVCEGPLNGYEGILLKVRGSGKKRLLLSLPGLLSASVEIGLTDYIELVDE